MYSCSYESCLCRFVFTFSLGAGPVPGLLLSEIFPGRIRAKAMAVCMAVHWVNPSIFSAMFCLSLFLLPIVSLPVQL